MTDEEYDAYVTTALNELEGKQDTLTAELGLGTHARFLLDQPSGTLRFFDDSGAPQVCVTVIPIGSYAEGSGTWKWSWANESIVEPLRSPARKLQELSAITGLEAFRDPAAFEADATLAWQAVAMAVQHLGALGCYRAPSRGHDLYLAIMEVVPPEGSAASPPLRRKAWWQFWK